ncbi:MAG: alpha/beta fold hydrolase [Tissierellia bacterium]|nr:alpha/beta fold hydrolase [Tissierellia bacterium]
MKYEFIELQKENKHWIRGVANFKEEKDQPVIIMFHGFTGNRIGNSFFFVQMAKAFVQAGYRVYRFDFEGSGESDGKFVDMTVSSEMEDGILIYEYVKKKHPNTDIHLLGFSLGGLVASLIAEKLQPKSLILLGPAANMLEIIDPFAKKIIGTEEENKVQEYGGVFLHLNFYHDLKKHNVYEKASLYDGPVIILRGAKDRTVDRISNEKLAGIFPKGHYVEIEGTDHSFTNGYRRVELIQKILEFLKES